MKFRLLDFLIFFYQLQHVNFVIPFISRAYFICHTNKKAI